jgi:hypothetical protein
MDDALPTAVASNRKDWNRSVWSFLCLVVGEILLFASPALLIIMAPVLIGGSCAAQAQGVPAAAPTPLVRAHVLTAKEVEAAKRDFAKMVNTLSSTNKDGQVEEIGRFDGEALANVAKQYELTDWWSFWFIKTYGNEEDLAKKIALRRYGSDETKVDPYVDSFVKRYKAIVDDWYSQYKKQEFDKLKFFMNQPLDVWVKYYGPDVTYKESGWERKEPDNPESGLDDGSYVKDKSPEARWHRWKTDRFDLMAHTYAGKVDYILVAALAGQVGLSRFDEIKALGESLGLEMTQDKNGFYQGENDQLFVHRINVNVVEVGTAQYLKRGLGE